MAFVAPLLGNIAINLAIGVATSVLASVLRPAEQAKPKTVTTQRGFSFEMTSGETVPYSAVFGIARAKGSLHYWNEYGEGENYHLQLVIRIGIGEHDGLETFLVDEKPVTLAGSNSDAKGRSVTEYTVSGTPYLWVKQYTGVAGQAADVELVAQAGPAGRWTTSSKMTGWAYLIVTVRYNADLYGSTLPRFGSVWRGLKLFDWREPGAVWGTPSTYVFSKNPAVIRHNFRRGIYVGGRRVLGMGFPAAAQDLSYYTAAANRCDEDFYDPASDTTFPVFEYGREIGDDEEKLAVLRELDASYAGSSFKRGGADAPLPAQQLVSVMTLNDGDRLLKADGSRYPVLADRKGSVSSKRTMWHGQFVSADAGWDLAPFTPRINTTLESVLGGGRAETIDQPFERLQERAQLRAEIALRRQIYAATRTETFGPKAFRLEPGDAITRVCEWGSMLMVVEKTEPLPDRTGVTITMSQWNNAIVPASGESFVTLPVAPGAGPADPSRTIAVSGGSIIAYGRSGGGAVHPFGKATWTAITDPNVDQVMIRLWPTSGTEADDKEDFFADSKLGSVKLCGPLSPLTAYTYKFRPIRSDGRTTVWSNTAEFTTGAEVAPAVAEGSITPAMLGQELSNISGPLMDDVYNRFASYDEQLGEMAHVVMGIEEATHLAVKGISLRNEAAAAAVLRIEEVITGPGSAFASLQEEVATLSGNLAASGMLRIESEVNELTGTSTILFKVKATNGVFTSEAALQLGATVTIDGEESFINAMADRLGFLSTLGAYVSQPFAINAGYVELQAVKFVDLYSYDLTSLHIHGGASGPSLIFEA